MQLIEVTVGIFETIDSNKTLDFLFRNSHLFPDTCFILTAFLMCTKEYVSGKM